MAPCELERNMIQTIFTIDEEEFNDASVFESKSLISRKVSKFLPSVPNGTS